MNYAIENQQLQDIVRQEEQDEWLKCDCCDQPADRLYVVKYDTGKYDTFNLCLKLFLEQPNFEEMLNAYTEASEARRSA